MITSEEIDAAVDALQRGELVGMPTETVYGLAADARNPVALAKIFATKGRPVDHPVIVHLRDASQMDAWAKDVPPAARVLADQFWPGPLTLILRRLSKVSDLITGSQETVGLRVPAHPVAHELLTRFGGGLAAPSANRFGRISPTTAAHVRAEFGDAVRVVLDGGPSRVGLESTIVDLSSANPRVLRPGSITHRQIEDWIGPLGELENHAIPRVSGALAAHYAPAKRLILVDADAMDATHAGLDPDVLWLGLQALPLGTQGIALGSEPNTYAFGLYAALRELDSGTGGTIAVIAPPNGEAWTAIHDRLRRAASGSGSGPLSTSTRHPLDPEPRSGDG